VHASTQAEHAMQSSAETVTIATSRGRSAAIEVYTSAPTGHDSMQGASAHCRQTIGRSMPSASTFRTRIRAFAVPKRRSCRATHASSHALQPLQRAASTRICI
jgi:hypothetical protein